MCRGVHLSAWKRTQSHTAAAARLDLGGIYPPIATPFTAKEDVDYQKLEGNLQKYAKIPFKGQAWRRERRIRNKTRFSGRLEESRKVSKVVSEVQGSLRRTRMVH